MDQLPYECDICNTLTVKRLILNLIVPVVLLTGAIFGLVVRDYNMVFYAISSVILCSFLPILSRLLKKDTAAWKNLAVDVFVFFSVFCSNIFNFYHRWWWYDIALHMLSGVFIALILPELIVPERVGKEMSAWHWFFFSIIVAITSAGFWEMTEFFFDIIASGDVQRNLTVERELFGVEWQNPGIRDTMNDIVNGTIGGIVGSIYFFFRKRR